MRLAGLYCGLMNARLLAWLHAPAWLSDSGIKSPDYAGHGCVGSGLRGSAGGYPDLPALRLGFHCCYQGVKRLVRGFLTGCFHLLGFILRQPVNHAL